MNGITADIHRTYFNLIDTCSIQTITCLQCDLITIINIPDGVNKTYEYQHKQSFDFSRRGFAWCI